MVKEWARNHPVSPQPIKLAFYSAFGPHQVAELIRGDETVAEGVARLTRGLADADAAFTHFTGSKRFLNTASRCRLHRRTSKPS